MPNALEAYKILFLKQDDNFWIIYLQDHLAVFLSSQMAPSDLVQAFM